MIHIWFIYCYIQRNKHSSGPSEIIVIILSQPAIRIKIFADQMYLGFDGHDLIGVPLLCIVKWSETLLNRLLLTHPAIYLLISFSQLLATTALFI